MTRLAIRPCSVKEAAIIVRQLHRHLPVIQGGLFACAVEQDGAIVGVAIAGNPAQEWQGTGRIVITRCAVETDTEGRTVARNASSKLYGAICRAAEALGYAEAWTYSLPEESGDSLRGAGFEDMGVSAGGEHDRQARPRAPAVRPDPKRRWLRRLGGGNVVRDRVIKPNRNAIQVGMFEDP